MSGNTALKQYRLLSAATTNSNLIQAGQSQVFTYSFHNQTAAFKFVKLYNKATAPTIGTDVPRVTIPVPPNSYVAFDSVNGIYFPLGLGVGVTNLIADADTTAVVANDVVVNLGYL